MTLQIEIQENKIEQTNPLQFFLDIPKEAIQQEKERLIDIQKTVLTEREQLLKKFKSLHKTRNEKYNQIIGTLSKDFNESLPFSAKTIGLIPKQNFGATDSVKKFLLKTK